MQKLNFNIKSFSNLVLILSSFFLPNLPALADSNQENITNIFKINKTGKSVDKFKIDPPEFTSTQNINLIDSFSKNKQIRETYISQSPEINLNKIEVINNTILTKEINDIIKPYKDQTISVEKLNEIADEITSLYLNQGYITTRAVLDRITDENVAIIRVDEGQIEKVEIEGAERLGNYVRQRIELGTSTPLNSGKLEDQLRLLKVDPLIENIEASLKKGTGKKQSILVVRVLEADPFFGEVGADNYSPPTIGGEEAVFNLGYRNVFGLGDGIAVSYRPRFQTWTGTYELDVNYSVPLNPMDGKINAIVLIKENEVVEGPFRDLDISGEQQYYELSYRQPIIRNPRQELALSVGMSYRNGQTFTFQGPTPFGIGPDEKGISRTNVISFGQDYALRQPTGAWNFRSQFRVGVGLFDVTTSDKNGDPDGYFFSWLGQIQRIQVINPDNFLIIQGDIQLTPDALLPSEQFVIGGGQSVRGYRQNVRAGDNGFRFSIEDRITLVRNDAQLPIFQLAPFWDMGSVWNVGSNPNIEPKQQFITALGLGFIFQPIEGLNIRIDYAPPLIDLIDRGNNIQDDGLYFDVKYNF
jgi:hemolysin activation/secretion protein